MVLPDWPPHIKNAKQLLALGAERLGVPLSDPQIELLLTYLSELTRWNEKINLTGIRQEGEIVIKHFLDSLTPLTILAPSEGEKWIDVGTGAGFPGLPLKIARPSLQMTLVEVVEKKASFLHHMVGLLNLAEVTIVQDRVERIVPTLGPDWEGRFDLLMTRAVAPDLILEKGSRLVRSGGRILFFQARAEETDWRERLKGRPGIGLERIAQMTLPFTREPRSLILLKVA